MPLAQLLRKHPHHRAAVPDAGAESLFVDFKYCHMKAFTWMCIFRIKDTYLLHLWWRF